MKKKSPTRGGVRVAGPGKRLGRPRDGAEAKEQYWLRLQPKTIRYLKTHGSAVGRFVEALVMASSGYEEWSKTE